MIGRFKYKRVATGSYSVYYQGPLDKDSLLLCTVVKTTDGKWEVPLTPKSLGPFQSRWHAAYAYLGHLIEEPARTLNKEVQSKWEELHLQRLGPRTLDKDFAEKVYDILIEKCGAWPEEKSSFVHAHTERLNTPDEWRFVGVLGFGGKFRNGFDRMYVDCYPENENPERLAIIAETNEAIFTLFCTTIGEK